MPTLTAPKKRTRKAPPAPVHQQGPGNPPAPSDLLKVIREQDEENFILRNALDELKRELDEERAKNQEGNAFKEKYLEAIAEKEEALKTAKINEADYDALLESYEALEKRLVTVSTLVNIPANLKDLVFELIKARLLVWDKVLMDGSKAAEEVTTENQQFQWLTDIIREEPETPAKGKRGKK